MKHIYYEIKKIVNIRFMGVYLLVVLIGALAFYVSLDKCMDELHIRNISHMIELYGNEKTYDMKEQLLIDYSKSRDILGQEDANMDKLLAGEMSHIEYSEYARLVARIKSYEKAWEYVLDKYNIVADNNGYIIVTEYWNCYFTNSLFQPGNILLFLLITCMLVAADKRRGMECVLAATYTGERNIRVRKGITAVLVTGFSVLMYQILIIGLMWIADRMMYIDAPMNSLGLYDANLEMAIRTFLCIYIPSISLLYAISSGIIVTLCSRYSETDRVTKGAKKTDGNS